VCESLCRQESQNAGFLSDVEALSNCPPSCEECKWERSHTTQSSHSQQGCHPQQSCPNARSRTAEKEHHNHTTRPVPSTPTGLAWNQSTGSARLLKPQTRPRPAQLEWSSVAAAGAGGQAHQRRWAGSLSCVLRAAARSSRPAPRNKVRLPRLLNLFYRFISTSHPSTFIQVPTRYHVNSNSVPSFLLRRAVRLAAPNLLVVVASPGRREGKSKGSPPITRSVCRYPPGLSTPSFRRCCGRHRRRLDAVVRLRLACPSGRELTTTAPSPPSTKVAREGIATPGQSTKHPSQLNHPCSHSQACMPSLRSMCSPPTQPGQPGH